MAYATSYADDLDDALESYDANRAQHPLASPPPQAPGAFAMRGGAERDPLGMPGAAPTTAPAALASPPPPGVIAMHEGPTRDPLGAPGAAPTSAAPAMRPAARSQAFDDELAPLATHRGRRLDPELAAMLESRKPATAGDTASDPNRALKIVDALASGLSQSRTGKGYDTAYWGSVDQRRRTDADHARALAAADPNSAISKQQRAAMGPLLAKIGLQPEEIGALSAADIRAMSGGGKIATVLAQSRERAAMAARQHDQALADAATKRVQDDDEWAHRNEITAAQALERARTMAGMQGAAYANRSSAEEAARVRAEQRAAERKTAEDEAAAKRKRADEARAAEIEDAKEKVLLDRYERELEARAKADPEGLLPGSEGKVEGALVEGKSRVFGGSGRNDVDSRLANGLDALGMSAYKNQNGTAANQDSERADAKAMFRGNGTNASALAAIRARKQAVSETRKARAALLGTGAGDAGGDAGGAGGGTTAPTGKRLRLPNGATVADTPGNRKNLDEHKPKIAFEVIE